MIHSGGSGGRCGDDGTSSCSHHNGASDGYFETQENILIFSYNNNNFLTLIYLPN